MQHERTMAGAPAYQRARRGMRRVVIKMDERDLEAVDRWGAPAGMLNRTEAIRLLIKKGLEAVTDAGSGR